ncbi:hypothetical protein [Thiocapsa roseopersicina]|uniref:Uncharacterized protein n=1 Tax=Thiocapsa roseopersicina TaxID=1058 RepID=A0A1H3CMP8_THIRO|nr:hypothetical protein [Thiocapsa roseopersicina]SDX55522.1 hypothetical protein SAMN05421783_1363 [Thiocapsa roseopersicina]
MIPKALNDRGMAAAFQAAQAAIAAHHAGSTAVAATCYAPPADPDSLMSSAAVRAFFDISAMTEWRWRKAGVLPEPIVIRNRNYYQRRAIAKVVAAQQSQSAVAA